MTKVFNSTIKVLFKDNKVYGESEMAAFVCHFTKIKFIYSNDFPNC